MAATYETKVHHAEGQAGGDELVIASGGKVTVESGGDIPIESGGTVTVKSGADIPIESGGTVTVESGGDIPVESGGTITIASGGDIVVGSGGKVTVEAGGILDMQAGSKQATPIANITSSRPVTVAESGTVFFLKAVDLKMTLPSTAVGLTYTFVVHTVSASTGAQIDPAALDAIMNAGDTSVDDKDLLNTPATDTEGDSVTIVGDGVDGWWVTAITGIWAKEG